MNTHIQYLYRDGANNKQGGNVVLAGTLTTDQMMAIRQACDEERYFIPGDVGLPELQSLWVEKGYPLTDDDHVWHELVDITTANAPPTLTMTAEEFAQRFASITPWDITGAMARVGLA